MGITRRDWLTGSLAFVAAPAFAQTYPSRPIKLVSPFAPGGGTDILGRLIAPRLGEILGGTMIVENRAGAGGNVGAQAVARAEPDGYTMLMGVNSYTINAHLQKNVPFDLKRDFTPVGMVATSPFLVVVHPSVPAKTIQEFVAYAKANPGKLNYGSAGAGTAPHLAGELFKLRTGIEMTHVPYQGSGPNVTGLLRGDVQMSAISMNSIEGFLGSNDIRVLAIMSPERIAKLPNVPTLAESGIADVNVDLWYAIFAPPALPPDLLATLNGALKKALADQDVAASFAKAGYLPAYSTSEQLAAIVDADLARWKDVIDKAKLRTE